MEKYSIVPRYFTHPAFSVLLCNPFHGLLHDHIHISDPIEVHHLTVHFIYHRAAVALNCTNTVHTTPQLAPEVLRLCLAKLRTTREKIIPNRHLGTTCSKADGTPPQQTINLNANLLRNLTSTGFSFELFLGCQRRPSWSHAPDPQSIRVGGAHRQADKIFRVLFDLPLETAD